MRLLFIPILLTLIIHTECIEIKLSQVGDEIVGKLTNTGRDQICIFRPSLPDQLGVRFVEVYQNTERVQYDGLMAKVDVQYDNSVCLSPAQSVEVTISMEANFDVRKNTEYSLTFDGHLIVVHLNRDYTTIDVVSNTLSVRFSRDFKIEHEKRDISSFYSGCSSSEISFINSAKSRYSSIKAAAYNLARPNTNFATYIGYSLTSSQLSHAVSVISKIYSVSSSSLDFACDGNRCGPGYFAYVYPGSPFTIYLCEQFWRQSHTGIDSSGGTLYHEVSHFTNSGNTADHAYGKSAVKNLAFFEPEKAINNAENYLFYAEHANDHPNGVN